MTSNTQGLIEKIKALPGNRSVTPRGDYLPVFCRAEYV